MLNQGHGKTLDDYRELDDEPSPAMEELSQLLAESDYRMHIDHFGNPVVAPNDWEGCSYDQ